MNILTIALLCAGALLVRAQDTCTVSLSVLQRPSATWDQEGMRNAIYDISVTNAGSCNINNVGINVFLPSGASIVNQWNLMADSRYWLLQNFGSELAPEATATAGIVVAFAAGATPDYSTVSAEVYGAACPTSCQISQEESSSDGIICAADIRECPDGSSVGRDPSNNCEFLDCPAGSSSDSASGSASDSTSEGSNECNIVATLARDENVWTDEQGRQNAVYRLTLSNQGSCPLKTYVTSFAHLPAEMTNKWNLASTLGGYKVEGFGDALAPGQSFNGAGFILAGTPANNVAVTPYGSVCEC
eukprot:TRINITY_DN1044_c0_g1_i2.p1 TRINITY_DN1044_c0_g1~~TRINITY_DN1044_c0_g1_i2.p1  ORF type:complete len:314 (-),score=84.23 TRINITY_DN1044_c0_g1_i2:78-983(-)